MTALLYVVLCAVKIILKILHMKWYYRRNWSGIGDLLFHVC